VPHAISALYRSSIDVCSVWISSRLHRALLSGKEHGKNSFTGPVMNTLLAPGDEHASFMLSRKLYSFLAALQFV
jgi:hypothetical protein